MCPIAASAEPKSAKRATDRGRSRKVRSAAWLWETKNLNERKGRGPTKEGLRRRQAYICGRRPPDGGPHLLRRPHRSTKASLVIIKPCRHPEPRDCFTYRLPEGPRPCNLRRQALARAGRPYNAPRTYVKRFETVASQKIVCSAWAPIRTSVDPATRVVRNASVQSRTYA